MYIVIYIKELDIKKIKWLYTYKWACFYIYTHTYRVILGIYILPELAICFVSNKIQQLELYIKILVFSLINSNFLYCNTRCCKILSLCYTIVWILFINLSLFGLLCNLKVHIFNHIIIPSYLWSWEVEMFSLICRIYHRTKNAKSLPTPWYTLITGYTCLKLNIVSGYF